MSTCGAEELRIQWLNAWGWMVTIHTVMDLKHPQALSLQSICLSICVFPPHNLHVPTSDVPETEGVMQRIRNWYPPNPRHRVLLPISQQAVSLPPAGESWNNTSQGDAQRERDLESVSLFTPKRLLPSAHLEKKRKKMVYVYVYFTKECNS